MKNLGSKVAAGAAWMIGLRLLQRSLGLISTAVLARLLLPADFGLIAMALSVSALVELITLLGFDLALIRKQTATREHFDTVWTLGLTFKAIAASVIVIGAPHVAAFYVEPRLTDVMYVYAAIALISGFENVGVVWFRKELDFNLEFRFQLTKKILAVCATVALAVYFRSYWALALGSLTSQLVGVVLSYAMHAYRPRFCLSAWREMLGFSSWVMFNNIAIYARDRGFDFIAGRILGAQALGGYRVANEVASLPTTELYMPIMRAVFPGFSKLVDDPPALQRAYLAAQAAVSALTLPAAIGVVLLAEPAVLMLLGSNWIEVIPIVQILGLYGATMILHGNRYSLFMAIGRPYWIGLMIVLELLVMYPLGLYWVLNGGGVEMLAWAKVIASLVTLPVGVALVSRVLTLSTMDFVRNMWRPIFGTASMSLVVLAVQGQFAHTAGAYIALWHFLTLALVGAITYVFALIFAWKCAGSPAGAERHLLSLPVARKVVPARLLGWLLG